jgi:NAD(P)-dependent dehydrogenase (short-subunit alcohol dehydrogenase family)
MARRGTAVVTGAGGGLGRAIAQRLATNGFALARLDRDPVQEHPASVGETYLQHWARATSFGLEMALSGLACLAHGVAPAGRRCATVREERS